MSINPSASRKIVIREGRITARKTGTLSASLSKTGAYLPLCDVLLSLEDWLRAGALQGHSPKTMEQRRDFIKKFHWHLTTHQSGETFVTTRAIEEFLLYLRSPLAPGEARFDSANPRARRSLSPTSVKNFYRILRAWCNWLHKKGRIQKNPMAGMDAPVARANQKIPYSKEELGKLLAAVESTTLPRRDTAIFFLLVETGIRAAELCSLTLADIDLDSRRVTVTGKGNKRRSVTFGAGTAQVLHDYLSLDARHPSDYVFVTEDGAALNPDSLLRAVRRWGRAANVAPSNVHRFRHTYGITYLVVRGGSGEFGLMESLGHTDLATTRHYVNLARANIAQEGVPSIAAGLGLAAPRRRGRPKRT